MAYWPEDNRTRFFIEANLQPVSGMPLLDDEQKVPAWPREGTRPMRDAYNENTPMHQIFENLWCGCARNAAWKNNVLAASGITHVLCVAIGAERRRSTWWYAPQDIPLLDINGVVEPAPAYFIVCFPFIHPFNWVFWASGLEVCGVLVLGYVGCVMEYAIITDTRGNVLSET